MAFSDLSSEQQKAFQVRLDEMGLSADDVAPRIGPDVSTGPTILSADPKESAIAPNVFTFENLAQMKQLIGNPDSDYESGIMDLHHETVPDWPKDDNALAEEQLIPDQRKLIDYALNAYLFGYSKNYESYRAIIEKTMFPMRFLVFAAEDVCLDATNSPLVIKKGSGLNFGTLTICEGGSISFEEDAVVTVQKMTKTDAASCKAAGV